MDRKYRMYDEETDRVFEVRNATFHEVEPLPVQTLRQLAEAGISIEAPGNIVNNPKPAVEEEQISLVCPIVSTPSSAPSTQDHQNQQTTLDNPTPSTSSSAQKTQQGEISIKYIPTTEQLADGLTKPLMKTKLVENRNELGLHERGIIRANLALSSPWIFSQRPLSIQTFYHLPKPSVMNYTSNFLFVN
ncbi:unnamed protein product [Allacma fusca]|uniref:Uncharacterized protein n=1 Tax=Allacma fusca TaxID=39272 RepID=A0A8J2NQX7_9HEXA|nr:unnamed protein product [Allacma fusca]